MDDRYTEDWDLWYPKAGSTGLPFARGRLGRPAEVLLVHAAPELLTATLRAGGRVLAEGVDLRTTDTTPIARLTRRGERIERADIWPGPAELGLLVLLPGGEVGELVRWWHAPDFSQWRWLLELSNRR